MRDDPEWVLESIQKSTETWAASTMDVAELIRVADCLGLGDRLFQKRVTELGRVEAFVDAALMIAEASIKGPMLITIRTGQTFNERPHAFIAGEPPVYANTLARAVLGAALQHRIKEQAEDRA